MKNQNPYYLQIYDRLLADIRLMSKAPLGTPDITDEWALVIGPRLDKQLLMWLEGLAEFPQFPEWLTPLTDRFFQKKDPLDLRYIRQLLVFCYKTEKEPTDAQLQEAQASFVDTDDSIDVWDGAFAPTPGYNGFVCARNYISRVICNVDWRDIMPSHGPGAVYPPANLHERTKIRHVFPSILSYYPLDQYYCPLPSFWDEVLVRGDGDLVVVDDVTCKLVAVPKDSRGPRLICVHPAESIWIQQGQRQLLERAIERSRLTSRSIRFTDQTANGNAALEASSDGYYCTLDLAEASDRISCKLVEFLFGTHAYKYLSCSRATHVRLLDGRLHRLRKWAPMGNALTFPVESLIFWALVRSGIKVSHGVNCDDILVFGDDILFPAKYYDSVIRMLSMAGCKPNTGKTFRNGLFRESCGVDAFNGVNVTPYRTRQEDIRTARGINSYIDLAKRLRINGYECSASFIYSSIRKRMGYLPLCNNPLSQGIVEYVNRDWTYLLRWEPRMKFMRGTQRWVVPCRQVKGVQKRPQKDDWYHLLDSLMRLHRHGDEATNRGLEYPLPYAAQLGYGWTDCLMN